MGEQVKIADVQTVERFRATLANAMEAFGLAVQDAESDVEKTLVWLDTEMTTYWTGQIRKAQEQVVMCKSALYRKQEIKATPEARPSVVSEKKALEKAKRRLELAEQKLASVRRWKMELPRQAVVFRGALAPMATVLDRDLPNVIAMLRRMAEHLEEYLRSSPEESERLLDILGVSSIKRSGEEADAGSAQPSTEQPSPEEPA